MIVLDTHAWVWWVNDHPRLGAQARQRIAAEDELGLCVISLWEVALLESEGRLELKDDVQSWLDAATAADRFRVLPLDARTCVESTHLPGPFHRDPADRFIVAAARLRTVPLMTADGKILAYPHVTTVRADQ